MKGPRGEKKRKEDRHEQEYEYEYEHEHEQPTTLSRRAAGPAPESGAFYGTVPQHHRSSACGFAPLNRVRTVNLL
jgi:hypothetical protein